jgi:hypothetical protein
MKKNLFILAAATLALASCSNEEMIELNKGNAIDFRAAMGVASRGDETTTANIGQFYVTAVDQDGEGLYFSEELFTNERSGTTLFESASDYYWPGTHTLNFYAYSYYTGKNSDGKLNAIDKSKLGTINIGRDSQMLEGFSPAENVADQIDFVSATTSASKAVASGLPLTFKHNLVETEVRAKTKNTNYTFEIKGIKFGNLVSKADFNFATFAWTPDESATTDYKIEYADVITLDPDATEVQGLSDITNVGRMMVLPQNLTKGETKTTIKDGSYIAVLLKITTNSTKVRVYPYVDNTEEYAWAYVPVDFAWTAGNRYIYTLDFSHGAGYDDNGDPILGGPIKFETKVTDWVGVDQDDTDMDVKDLN